MLKNLWNNLTKKQKIGVIIFIQLVFVVLMGSIFYRAFQPKESVEVANESEVEIPNDYWRGVKDQIWYLVENNISDLTQANIDDAVIREGTYEESTNDDITTATFLVDIESLRQTYAVTVSWSEKIELYDAIQVNCPPRSEMKYPETVCYGMYNDTYSLDLYLPHVVYPQGYEDEDSAPVAPNYAIHGDEESKTINITVSACDVNKNKNEAMEYLQSTPLILKEYTINYEVNNVNVDCS